MGGHGGLNILPQKSWHVYNLDNRLRVDKDKEEAAVAAHEESGENRDLNLFRAVTTLRKRQCTQNDRSAPLQHSGPLPYPGHLHPTREESYYSDAESASTWNIDKHIGSKRRRASAPKSLERLSPSFKTGLEERGRPSAAGVKSHRNRSMLEDNKTFTTTGPYRHEHVSKCPSTSYERSAPREECINRQPRKGHRRNSNAGFGRRDSETNIPQESRAWPEHVNFFKEAQKEHEQLAAQHKEELKKLLHSDQVLFSCTQPSHSHSHSDSDRPEFLHFIFVHVCTYITGQAWIGAFVNAVVYASS